MRTFPNAPFPTTRRSRKWLRLTIVRDGTSAHLRRRRLEHVRKGNDAWYYGLLMELETVIFGELTFIGENDGLAIGIAH